MPSGNEAVLGTEGRPSPDAHGRDAGWAGARSRHTRGNRRAAFAGLPMIGTQSAPAGMSRSHAVSFAAEQGVDLRSAQSAPPCIDIHGWRPKSRAPPHCGALTLRGIKRLLRCGTFVLAYGLDKRGIFLGSASSLANLGKFLNGVLIILRRSDRVRFHVSTYGHWSGSILSSSSAHDTEKTVMRLPGSSHANSASAFASAA